MITIASLRRFLEGCVPFDVTFAVLTTDTGENYAGYRYKRHNDDILVVVPRDSGEEIEINMLSIEEIKKG